MNSGRHMKGSDSSGVLPLKPERAAVTSLVLGNAPTEVSRDRPGSCTLHESGE
jgi:hypothetical protein